MTKIAVFDAADYLSNEETIAEYISAALEDPNPDVFVTAVRDTGGCGKTLAAATFITSASLISRRRNRRSAPVSLGLAVPRLVMAGTLSQSFQTDSGAVVGRERFELSTYGLRVRWLDRLGNHAEGT